MQKRVVGKISVFLIAVFEIFNLNFSKDIEIIEDIPAVEFSSYHPFVGNYFPELRDTIFTDKDHYIEVDLSTQMASLHHRTGEVWQFGISSGNPDIEEAIETPQGIFVVFKKERVHYSDRFDSTYMPHWMPFYYGVGFHGLAGRSYYKFLGKTPSSHGCVRTGNEDVKELFETIDVGTPVIVHEGNNAVILEFTRPGVLYEYVHKDDLKELMGYRLQALYDGTFFMEEHKQLLFKDKYHPWSRVPLGDRSKVRLRQILPQFFIKTRPLGGDVTEMYNTFRVLKPALSPISSNGITTAAHNSLHN